MGLHIIDIINFILVFLLMDYFNGLYGNYLSKKLKSGVLTVAFLLVSSLILSAIASFWLCAKIALLTVVFLVILGLFVLKTRIKQLSRYSDVDCSKERFFANKKVMIIVPHEDDDVNLAGGVIEQYVKYGSDVYVVFATNGDGDKRFDMSKMGYIRMREAVNVLALLGVPEKNVVFLGYGDGWGEGPCHVYNAQPNDVICSTSKRTKTYGLENHPAYNEGKSYTYSHYLDDITQIVLEYTPDIIFCIDYDTHNDHRALSMLFEKAMGNILKTTEYRPIVYKGYGYRTAWRADSDFYDSINVLSTKRCLSEADVNFYDWNKRVRFPIDINSVNRCLLRSKLYDVLSLYASQKANESASKIINGDKVFWLRRTDSVLYNAKFTVSSGQKEKLSDFMLLDCDDLVNHGNWPFDGVWHPDADDDEKSVCITFDGSKYIENIVLYDNPSINDNILNAVIILDDGSKIETGRLSDFGQATVIDIQKEISSFTVKLDKYEGENFGLTEIEAYASSSYESQNLYKLIDDKDNFVYDYIVPIDGKQVLKIYSTADKEPTPKDFNVRCDNKKCTVRFEDEKIAVHCPVGHKCQVELLSQDNSLLDRVVLRNPRKIERDSLQKNFLNKPNYSYISRLFRLNKK